MENIFDINHILKHSFVAHKKVMQEKKIELIFDVNTTIPRELRGNNIVLEQLITSILGFVFNFTSREEIVLSLDAQEDFLYEEDISFKILQTGIAKEKVLAFLETALGNNLVDLDGKIIYDENDIHLAIPFTIGELGFRRHYRLPSKSMLGKKVLLLVESEPLTNSIMKMFSYFSYDVEKELKKESTTLAGYDFVIIEDHLVTERVTKMLSVAIKNTNLKYVLLGNQHTSFKHDSEIVTTHLIKPVTQESIFELIVLLFAYDISPKKKKIVTERTLDNVKTPTDIVIPESLQMKSEDQGVQNLIEEKKSQHVAILDTKLGLENAKKQGLIYSHELENFMENFNKSDLYFRQIVNEKQSNKIKDFCIDLEKQAKIIGAESMLKFSDTVSLIFVYDKLDMLPIYPGRYHIELTKLVSEIKKYLHI
jgi:hypothetical protein